MGWSISCVVNTVKIPKKVAKAVVKAAEDDYGHWMDEASVTYEGKLSFDPDDMEHMDYVSLPSVQKALKAGKVKGDICFVSLEGDNAGDAWGYRFDGKGGMITLHQVTIWKEDKMPS